MESSGGIPGRTPLWRPAGRHRGKDIRPPPARGPDREGLLDAPGVGEHLVRLARGGALGAVDEDTQETTHGLSHDVGPGVVPSARGADLCDVSTPGARGG